MSGSLTTFQTPIANGITPGGPLGAQIAAITRRAVIPTVFVQCYQAHPVLSMLMSNAQMAKGGVNQITIPVQGGSFVSFSWGGFAGAFDMPEDTQQIQNAQFNLKLGMVPIGFFGMETLLQSSEVIIPKLRAVTSDAAVVMKQALAQALYQQSYGQPLALDSLSAAYDLGGNSPVYGGINRTSNAFWQGQFYPNQASISNRVGVANLLVRVMSGAGGEAADFMVMNPANWATLMSDFMSAENFQTTPRSIYNRDDVVNAGFRAIRVLDTPIFPDPFCPIGEAYAINSRYIALYLSQSIPFSFSGFQSLVPQGQIADIGVLISALNLVCAKPSSGAHITGLMAPGWPGSPPPPPVVANPTGFAGEPLV